MGLLARVLGVFVLGEEVGLFSPFPFAWRFKSQLRTLTTHIGNGCRCVLMDRDWMRCDHRMHKRKDNKQARRLEGLDCGSVHKDRRSETDNPDLFSSSALL